ncbi:uncharacterized protein LOC120110489 isoform X2 [Phoenix dactylifera]|uniref:Uncharacterized protein LOC120110489 isoform X2 n=1 Tax=Phoenix dactylifera TaxID=42345 RepID=A0A8B9A740_PHODC|nr:uncharacterized protein LOC120110489 isoform X2 [Phoenix dactylifera]
MDRPAYGEETSLTRAPPSSPPTLAPTTLPPEPSSLPSSRLTQSTTQPSPPALSEDQLQRIASSIVDEIASQGKFSGASSTKIPPSNAALTQMVADMRAELVSLRCLLQGQYRRFVNIEEDTRKLQESIRRDLEKLNENAKGLANKLLEGLHKNSQSINQLSKSYQESSSEILQNLGDICDAVRVLLESQSGSSSSRFTAP